MSDGNSIKNFGAPGPLLVAVSASPFSEGLVLQAEQMATNLGAHWIALFVDTGKKISVNEQAQLKNNLDLAVRLGAEVLVSSDTDVSRGLMRIARQRNAWKLIIGKPGKGSWKDFFNSFSPVRRVIIESGKIDVVVLRAEKGREQTGEWRKKSRSSRWKERLFASVMLITVIVVNFKFLYIAGPRSVALILLLSVVIAGLVLDRWSVLAYAFVSALLWNFIFLEPRFTFNIRHIEDAIMFFMYFFIAIVTGSLTARIRNQERASGLREEQLAILYSMTREFASFRNIDDAARHLGSLVGRFFHAESVFYIATDDGLPRTPHPASTAFPSSDDFSSVLETFNNRKPSMRAHGESGRWFFVPILYSPEKTVGVFGILSAGEYPPSIDKATIIEAMAAQLALFIERDKADQIAEKGRLMEASEKLYRVILNSISHELKTPLSAIKGSVSTLVESGFYKGESGGLSLLAGIRSSADRLAGLVDNFLDMSRIESGRLSINTDWNDMEDIIGVVLERIEKQSNGRQIDVMCPDDLPLVCLDFTLVAQALYCLLHNAIVHSGHGPVCITAAPAEKGVKVIVEDAGAGIKREDIERIFDKFYRGISAKAGGLGLGLSIARGVAELHGGGVIAENREPSGARFIMTLPVETRLKSST